MADEVLRKFSEDPNKWPLSSQILVRSTDLDTRFFALQLLLNMIERGWRYIDLDGQKSIRNFATSELRNAAPLPKHYRARATKVVLAILGRAYPEQWPDFMREVISGASTPQECNVILILLEQFCEDLESFGKTRFTSARLLTMQRQLSADYATLRPVLLACVSGTDEGLAAQALRTICAFMRWQGVGGDAQDLELVKQAVNWVKHKSGATGFETITPALEALSYFARIDLPDALVVQLFSEVMGRLTRQVVDPADRDYFPRMARADHQNERFINAIAKFLIALFKKHSNVIEQHAVREQGAVIMQSSFKTALMAATLDSTAGLLQAAHKYIASMLEVGPSSFIYKTVLDYLRYLAADISTRPNIPGVPSMSVAAGGNRLVLYRPFLQDVFQSVVYAMPRPKEVLFYVDHSGEVVREIVDDLDVIETFKQMQLVVTRVGSLIRDYAITLITKGLLEQATPAAFNPATLNSLCWSIPALAKSLSAKAEQNYVLRALNTVITILEMHKIPQMRALAAAGVMYVCSKVPRFLRAHWQLLTTVISKLQQFLSEQVEGVKDMAVETIADVMDKCGNSISKNIEYVRTLVGSVYRTGTNLNRDQSVKYYHAMGKLLSTIPPGMQTRAIQELLGGVNAMWQALMRMAEQDRNLLLTPEPMQRMYLVISANQAVCEGLGKPSFKHQVAWMFLDLSKVLRLYTNFCQQQPRDRLASGLRGEILKLFASFVRVSTANDILQDFLPKLQISMQIYRDAQPQARDPAILELCSAIIRRCGERLKPEGPDGFGGVFYSGVLLPTYEMAQDPSTYPEFREGLTDLVAAIIDRGLPFLAQFPPAIQIKFTEITFVCTFNLYNSSSPLIISLPKLAEMLATPQFSQLAQIALPKLFPRALQLLIEHDVHAIAPVVFGFARAIVQVQGQQQLVMLLVQSCPDLSVQGQMALTPLGTSILEGFERSDTGSLSDLVVALKGLL
eukprot:gnl/Dysnectes_brevis/2782_a3391_1100.p1 GENE.gnl/Dysnectes_brevis/2782_a3391_1100~~gnl/Dysnectes_brevis/2782_a3391_1100.p1  ORF type:complete len:1008 (-),score=381.85 gnl/Dysnectes_brevis/2782_a3391_1100:66-2957(-)